MAGFGPILCATDFSTFSERAFVHAAALARACLLYTSDAADE